MENIGAATTRGDTAMWCWVAAVPSPNILHGVHAALVDAHGFNTDAPRQPEGLEGNVVFLHLFMDGLALQSCNPIMLNARDAFIQADENRYDGNHVCLLWKAFAARGMGVNAQDYDNNFDVPISC
ncbi:putative extracellular elastinolytic metallo proteinase precursor [Mycena vitilis]|nr:putative extracellular elastinolytic metallo proteinase precursor [Mycena vitilis]